MKYFIRAIAFMLLIPISSYGDLNKAEKFRAKNSPKRILLLYSYGYGGSGVKIFDEGFFSVVYHGGISANDLYFEFLDIERNKENGEYRSRIQDLLIHEYVNRKINLIITVQQPALNFLLNEGKNIAPDAPVITVQAPIPAEAGTRRLISQVAQFDIKGTLELAIDLFPKTSRVVFVSGSSEADKKMTAVAVKVAESWQGKLEFEYTSELSIDEMLLRIANLPPDTIIIFIQYNRDTSGRTTLAYEVEGMITKAANCPVFGLYDFNLRNGGIGGSVISVRSLGETTGQLALDILNNKLHLTQPFTEVKNKVVPMFDWKQITRWEGDDSRLPKESVILNKPESVFVTYRNEIIAISIVFIMLFIFIIVMGFEILRRKRIEEALRESRHQAMFLSDLLEHSSQPFSVGYLDGRIGVCNTAFSELLGYSKEELMTLNWSKEITDPKWLPIVKAKLEELHSTGQPVRYEREYIRKDGSSVPVEVLVHLVKDESGQPKHYYGFVTDITERKKAEERFRILFEQAAVGVAQIDTKTGQFLKINKKYCDIIGYTLEEMTELTFQKITHSEDLEADLQNIQFLIEGKIREFSMETRYYHKNGSIVWVNLTVSPMWKISDPPDYHIAVVENITERKHSEQERKKLESQLRQAQKMEAIGQLAGGVAHDFNNLLHVITGYTDMSLAQLHQDGVLYNNMNEVMKAAQRAATLVRQLLLFSRREAMQQKYINLNELIGDLMNMIRRIIGEHISLDIHPGSNLKTIYADPGQLEQVLMNLCINARDAMPDGGKILIETDNISLSAAYCEQYSWAKQGDYVLLTVSDTGCGIPAEIKDRIFEPFFTTKEVGKGTGLGLAAVYGIVRSHLGMVRVYSEDGNGTSFRIYLPIAESDTTSASDYKESEKPSVGGKETLLVAEDDETVRTMLVQILQDAGYQVIAAKDGEEAVLLFEEHSAETNLALLDVVMPKVSGQKVYERIRAVKPDLPVIFITGYSRGILDSKSFIDTRYAILQKPCNPNDLLRKVRDVMDSGNV